MPNFCAVVGCGNRGDRDRNSFFRFPCIPKSGNSSLVKLKTKRRMKWILALRRADMTETKLKYAKVCDRHFISGHPASNHDTENPDWVPSINMGYPEEPRVSSYTSPHIEYIRRNIVSQNKSNGTAYRNRSSLRMGFKGSILNKNSNVSQVTESSTMFTYYNTSLEKNLEEINSVEENVSKEEIVLPEKIFVHSKVMTSYKNAEDEEIISDKVNTLEFADNNSELHQNSLSKKVQTDLTMIDLDKISNAFKIRVHEVNQLKAKLKYLTENILQLNEVYC